MCLSCGGKQLESVGSEHPCARVLDDCGFVRQLCGSYLGGDDDRMRLTLAAESTNAQL